MHIEKPEIRFVAISNHTMLQVHVSLVYSPTVHGDNLLDWTGKARQIKGVDI